MAWRGCSAVHAYRCRMTAISIKGNRATEAPDCGQVEAKTRCRQGRVDLSSLSGDPRLSSSEIETAARRFFCFGADVHTHRLLPIGRFKPLKIKQVADWNGFRHEPAADRQFGEAESWGPLFLVGCLQSPHFLPSRETSDCSTMFWRWSRSACSPLA